MSVGAKQIEHRACYVPPPGDTPEYYDIRIDAAFLRDFAQRFGLEVIDIKYVRSVLKSVADKAEADARLVPGEDCTTCGLPHMHVGPACVVHTP